MMRVFALGLALIAGPAAAQGFAPPAGCTAKLTVQFRACMVLNVWSCDADPAGTQWAALFDDTGLIRLRRVDAEYQWLETFYFRPDHVRRMQSPAPDPESLTELFATSHDTYDFTILDGRDGSARRYVGFDRLTGSTVIDDVPLQTTEFGYTILDEDGIAIGGLAGRQYVSEEFRLFFFGESWSPDDPEAIRNNAPVSFVFPGEAGFFSPDPAFGCDMMMSSHVLSTESHS